MVLFNEENVPVISEYLPRVIDRQLTEYLCSSGAVLLSGPKWCGKTTTAEQQAKSVLYMQDPDRTKGYLATAESAPSVLLRGANPRLLDEWQMAPVLWDAVRHAVDRRDESGLFILTGSTTVDESLIMNSGTGRIARMVMYPMSLYESGDSNGEISLFDLFNDHQLDINGITTDLTIDQLVFATCRGGWPSSLSKTTELAMLQEPQKYIDNICSSDASTVDGIKRNPARVRAVLKAYARNISTLASDKSILRDITSHFMDFTQPTLSSYVEALERLYVIENIPAWYPSIRSATSIRTGKKKSFIDPSIAVAAYSLAPEALLFDLNTFGFMFENLCVRDLKVYSSAIRGRISYYNDRYGLEADCVLHLDDGRYALIECKLGSSEIEKAASHLIDLKNLIKKAIVEERVKIREPDMLIVLTGGEMAYTRKDGVKIIPIGTLKN